jgi:hypothetical protein
VRVAKTHITFALDADVLQRIEQLFFTEDCRVAALPGYSTDERANPFTTYAAIPAAARYRFMLENAEYLVRTFIRDHFWVIFQDPESDPYVVDNAYRGEVNALLALPGVEDDILEGAEIWFESTEDRNRYTAMRQEAFAALQPGGAGLSSIWNGNVALQAQTRLYFDLMRNGAEQNFLRLLPPVARQDILDSWYAGSGQLKLWFSYQSIDTESASAVAYETDSSGEELLKPLPALFEPINATPDPINRGGTKPKAKGLGRLGSDREGDSIPGALADVPAAQMPAIAHLPDASILQVVGPDDRLAIYTLVRNRRHSNVAFLLGESLRYQPDKDTLTVVPGVATVNPNFMFVVPDSELTDFTTLLRNEALDDRALFVERVVFRWGVRRSSPDFWSRFHALNRYLYEHDSVEAGMLDLNRYVDP